MGWANPHGLGFRPGRVLTISMPFQGLDQQQAEAVWHPFFDWASEAPQDFVIDSLPKILAVSARRFWDPVALRQTPSRVIADDREGAPADNIFWAGNLIEAGQILYAYQSAWLPASLLEAGQRQRLADGLFSATKHWGVTLHVNKGLAGARSDAIAAAKDTSINPAVADAFALAISAAAAPPAYPGVPGHEPDEAAARRRAAAVDQSMNEIRKLTDPSRGIRGSRQGDFATPARAQGRSLRVRGTLVPLQPADRRHARASGSNPELCWSANGTAVSSGS